MFSTNYISSLRSNPCLWCQCKETKQKDQKVQFLQTKEPRMIVSQDVKKKKQHLFDASDDLFPGQLWRGEHLLFQGCKQEVRQARRTANIKEKLWLRLRDWPSSSFSFKCLNSIMQFSITLVPCTFLPLHKQPSYITDNGEDHYNNLNIHTHTHSHSHRSEEHTSELQSR